MGIVERIWGGEDGSAALARGALAPLSALYGVTMRARRALYAARVLPSADPELPVLSVGNLSVGGTGKTPFAAWVTSRLRARARPAILLRGYGGDEAAVHARLNPGVPVVVSADRLAGVREARGRGADVVVADDAFQHQRMRRSADVVLLSVEQLERPVRVLPAGPWRESLDALREADLVVLTRKAAGPEARDRARALVARHTRAPVATVHLAPAALVQVGTADGRDLAMLRGETVHAVAAIGEPAAFARQLEALGARVHLHAFRDHHPFTRRNAEAIARDAAGGLVVCTLKDAVKLGPLWPPSSRLWYVSQQLLVEEGLQHIDRILDGVLSARSGATTTAG